MGLTLLTTTISNARAFFVVLKRDEYRPKVIHLKMRIAKYAKEHKSSVFINAGLFRLWSKKTNGQFVVDGKDLSVDKYITDDVGYPIGDNECYPLIIDNDGNLLITSHDRTSPLNHSKYLADHYRGAVCGWGTLIEDGTPTDFINQEIRWGKDKKSRQIIGYLDNGDYFILTCNNAYYKDIYEYLSDKHIKFAYSLDGGRSTKLFIDGKRLNTSPIKFGVRYRIPSVIEFEPINK